MAYNLAGGCTHTWPHSYLNLDEQSWDAPSASGFVPWVCGPRSPRGTLTVELEVRQQSSLPAAVGARCSRMVPTCSGCIELSYESSAPAGCPATHLQSPPGAGRRAPLLRRLSAAGVRPRPPLSGWSRAASPNICPVSTTLGGGGGFEAGLWGPGLGRASRPDRLSRPLVARPCQAGTSKS